MKIYVDLRYSKDGGHNWSDWRKLSIGEVGYFKRQVETRAFGQGVDWVFDIRITDPVKCDIMAAQIMAEQTQS